MKSMNTGLPSAQTRSQADEEWRLARKHQEHMWLDPTHVWAFISPDAPQARLFAGAAGANAGMMRQALDAGADSRSPLLYQWPGVSGGELQFNDAAGMAYEWRSSPQNRNNSAAVCTPIESAIAGACADCLQMLIADGANLEAGLKWFVSQLPTLPRLEAGLTLCAVADAHDLTYRVPLRAWLERGLKWLAKHHRLVCAAHQERMLAVYQGLRRVAPAFGLHHDQTC